MTERETEAYSDQLLVVPDADTPELLDEGRRLADLLERTDDRAVEMVAVAFEGIVDADDLTELRPDELLVVDREGGSFESGAAGVDARVRALESVVGVRDPLTVLVPSTPDGDEIAARLAATVRGSGLTNCLLQVRDGELSGGRPAYDGRAFAEYDFERQPVVASLAVEGLSTSDKRSEADPVRTDRTVDVADGDGIERLAVAEVPEEDLERAQRVVAGGYGLNGPDGFDVVADLADALGATLGASRPPVDDGWLAYDKQIGVTGKPVDAELYVPCAISGDPYHMAAVEADTVIPINTDPNARIFEFADLGIVGDVYEYAPVIASAIREAREAGDADADKRDATPTVGTDAAAAVEEDEP